MLDEIRIRVLKSLYHTHYYGGRGLYSYIINSYLSCKNPLKLFCEEHVKDGTCIHNKNYPFSIYEIRYLQVLSLIPSYPLPSGWTLHADHLQVSWSLWLGFSPLMDLNLTRHTSMNFISLILIVSYIYCASVPIPLSYHDFQAMTPLKIQRFW